jgi:hypothetical protein
VGIRKETTTLSPSGNLSDVEISERTLQRIGLILLALAVVFVVIGGLTSPLDENGKPVLLLPEIKAFEDYSRSGREWLDQMLILDSEISGVLSGENSGDLYTQSRQAQQMLQQAVDLAKEIDQVNVPAAAAGIHDQLYNTSMAYLETARLTMRWVGAPEETTRQQIEAKLKQARNGRNALKENQWLKQP